MRRTEALQGARMAVFLNLLHRWESAELNQEEAAELLGVSERTFRRWMRRSEEGGEAARLASLCSRSDQSGRHRAARAHQRAESNEAGQQQGPSGGFGDRGADVEREVLVRSS